MSKESDNSFEIIISSIVLATFAVIAFSVESYKEKHIQNASGILELRPKIKTSQIFDRFRVTGISNVITIGYGQNEICREITEKNGKGEDQKVEKCTKYYRTLYRMVDV